MILYTEKDKTIWDSIMNDKLETIEKDKQTKFTPTRKEIDHMTNIIMKYIKDTNKKIYGGFAQNKLVEIKNPKDAFYEKDKIPDINIYSPTPIIDVINVCNLLYKEGIKHIDSAVAQHEGTYRIYAEFVPVLDITYVPTNVFNRMPFIEVDGIKYVKPWFMMLDMYKMLTDPYHSSFRWEKMFSRIMVVQKNYPFKQVKQPLVPYWDINSLNDDTIKMVLNSVYSFLKNNNSIIVIGHYTYNYLLSESGIIKNNKNYNQYNIPYYQFVSIDYKNDSLKLFNLLKEQYNGHTVTLVEHYPLWTLYGYNNYISVNGKLVCHIIHYDRRCTPVKQVIPKMFAINNKSGGKSKNNTNKANKGDFIQIASFDYMLLTTMAYSIKGRVIKDEKMEIFYYNMTSMLVEMRNYYLKHNNKTMFDNTIFEEYLVTCIGDSIDPGREMRLKGQNVYKQKKRRFRYKPEENFRETETGYKFPNTSGNIINKIKNFRVLNDKYVDKLIDFEEDDDEEDNNDTN